jgi:signal transduction histidine kinase
MQPQNEPLTEKGQVEKEISKVRQLFFQLLHNYPDGAISIIDRNHNFIFTGGELHKRLNIDPGELIGHEIYPKFPQKVRDVIKVQLKKVFQGNNIIEFELPYPIKSQIYVMDMFPLKEEDDSVLYAGVIFRNISHLKLIENELKQSLEKERELSELKSRFLTMASHEFRTPLSNVLLSAQLLKKYTAVDAQPNRDKHIGRIVSSVNLITDILSDFLSVEKIEKGVVKVNLETLDIKAHITSIIKEIKETQKKEQEIFYRHIGEKSVALDPFLLKEIIVNLLSNAIKFSIGNLPIEVKTEWINSRLSLSIKDYGIGIPPDYRQHLFERLYRASNVTNIGGTGLGLYITSKYVELMNGTIQYTSELQKGTQFVIIF